MVQIDHIFFGHQLMGIWVDCIITFVPISYVRGAFQVVIVVKNLPAKSGDKRCGFDPWVGKIPQKRAWQPPLKYLCLEDPMARGAWQGTVHGVTESDSRSSQSSGRGWQTVSTTFMSTCPLLTTCLYQLSGSIWALFLSPGERSETKIEHCVLPRVHYDPDFRVSSLNPRTTPTWVGV